MALANNGVSVVRNSFWLQSQSNTVNLNFQKVLL